MPIFRQESLLRLSALSIQINVLYKHKDREDQRNEMHLSRHSNI